MIKKFIIVGAGMSGLNTAQRIRDLDLGSAQVLEKSRGVGGRLATRRTLDTRFDHGAQFYRVKDDIADLHQRWKQSGVSHQWFVSIRGDHWCSSSGMTALSKQMAEGLDISLGKEISTVRYEDELWKLTSKENEEWSCHSLIISSPIPQTVRLLEDVEGKQLLDAAAFKEIKEIRYTKALVALVTLEKDVFINENGYIEFQGGSFFSISDQRRKGMSVVPALTITMSSEFSEKEFESSDDDIMKRILNLFCTSYPDAKIERAELKKWRYCQSKSHSKKLFVEIAPKLYLIGDAFGGSSVLGAIRSSEALINSLTESIR